MTVYQYTNGPGGIGVRLIGDQGPVVVQPAGEEVYRVLRRMILSGELREEGQLVERRLARQLGVSRTPVREALRKLEAEGLVERAPYRGLVVADLKSEDVEEMFHIREVLEGLAARLAATRRTKAHVRALRSLATRMEKAREQEDVETFGRLHLRFHNAFAQAAGSPRLYGLLSGLQEYLSVAAMGYQYVGRTQQACEEHRALVERIAEGEADQAEAAARAHIRHSKEALLAVLRAAETGGAR